MARNSSMAAWIAGGAAALLLAVPAPARACDAHEAGAGASVDAKLKAEAADSSAKQPELLAEKCKCEGPSDCTCKKGQCGCSKCSKPRYKVMESLRDRRESHERPVRRNAAAGTFI